METLNGKLVNSLPDSDEKVTDRLDEMLKVNQHLEVLVVREVEEFRDLKIEVKKINNRLVCIENNQLKSIERKLATQTFVMVSGSAIALAGLWCWLNFQPQPQPKIHKKAEVIELRIWA
jgi:hypothetical protein